MIVIGVGRPPRHRVPRSGVSGSDADQAGKAEHRNRRGGHRSEHAAPNTGENTHENPNNDEDGNATRSVTRCTRTVTLRSEGGRRATRALLAGPVSDHVDGTQPFGVTTCWVCSRTKCLPAWIGGGDALGCDLVAVAEFLKQVAGGRRVIGAV